MVQTASHKLVDYSFVTRILFVSHRERWGDTIHGIVAMLKRKTCTRYGSPPQYVIRLFNLSKMWHVLRLSNVNEHTTNGCKYAFAYRVCVSFIRLRMFRDLYFFFIRWKPTALWIRIFPKCTRNQLCTNIRKMKTSQPAYRFVNTMHRLMPGAFPHIWEPTISGLLVVACTVYQVQRQGKVYTTSGAYSSWVYVSYVQTRVLCATPFRKNIILYVRMQQSTISCTW